MKIMTCADLTAAWRDNIDPSTRAALQALLQALLAETASQFPTAVEDDDECWNSAIHVPDSSPTCLIVATVNALSALSAEAQQMRESLSRIKELANGEEYHENWCSRARCNCCGGECDCINNELRAALTGSMENGL